MSEDTIWFLGILFTACMIPAAFMVDDVMDSHANKICIEAYTKGYALLQCYDFYTSTIEHTDPRVMKRQERIYNERLSEGKQ